MTQKPRRPSTLTPTSWDKLEGLLPPLSVEEENSLKNSIKENGVLDPVKVLPDGRIVDGYHRWKLSDHKAPVKILNLSEDEALCLALNLNTSRRHLSPDQKRDLVLTLRKRRYSQQRVSELTGFSRAYVSSVEKLEDFRDVRTVNSKSPDLRIKIPEEEHSRIYERSKEEPLNKLAADYKVTPGRISQILQGHEKELERKAALEELERRADRLPPLVAQFSTIVLDPPWPYEGVYDPKGHRGTPPYPVMSVDEIKALKVPAASDCILWLWTTNAFLHESFHVLESWGFVAKTVLTWAKDSIGLGKWLRGQTEHCIVAVKGNPKIRLTSQSTLLRARAREHSRKPDDFYQLVDSLCEGPKLDYFGREKRDGWTVYGTSA
jgi:N6-adenosine-specific RNA methylase IME4